MKLFIYGCFSYVQYEKDLDETTMLKGEISYEGMYERRNSAGRII